MFFLKWFNACFRQTSLSKHIAGQKGFFLFRMATLEFKVKSLLCHRQGQDTMNSTNADECTYSDSVSSKVFMPLQQAVHAKKGLENRCITLAGVLLDFQLWKVVSCQMQPALLKIKLEMCVLEGRGFQTLFNFARGILMSLSGNYNTGSLFTSWNIDTATNTCIRARSLILSVYSRLVTFQTLCALNCQIASGCI